MKMILILAILSQLILGGEDLTIVPLKSHFTDPTSETIWVEILDDGISKEGKVYNFATLEKTTDVLLPPGFGSLILELSNDASSEKLNNFGKVCDFLDKKRIPYSLSVTTTKDYLHCRWYGNLFEPMDIKFDFNLIKPDDRDDYVARKLQKLKEVKRPLNVYITKEFFEDTVSVSNLFRALRMRNQDPLDLEGMSRVCIILPKT